jgi:hypothetical protein
MSHDVMYLTAPTTTVLIVSRVAYVISGHIFQAVYRFTEWPRENTVRFFLQIVVTKSVHNTHCLYTYSNTPLLHDDPPRRAKTRDALLVWYTTNIRLVSNTSTVCITVKIRDNFTFSIKGVYHRLLKYILLSTLNYRHNFYVYTFFFCYRIRFY